jgi:hypothetical protein
MKYLILTILSCVLLVSCGTTNKSNKIDEELLNKFPSDTQELLKDVNPDLIDIKYLIDNSEKYKTELDSDRNDFFVVVKGDVTEIDKTDYSGEDLSIMENKEAAELLKNTISYDIHLDNNSIPLSDNILLGEPEPKIETGKEYYFFIHVSKIVDDYNYSIIDCFNLN